MKAVGYNEYKTFIIKRFYVFISRHVFTLLTFLFFCTVFYVKLKCGPIPNVMAAQLPNIGGALCSTPQSLADTTTSVPCSNAAKMQNPLKFAGGAPN